MRQVAFFLLRFAERLPPADSKDWGRAMLAELDLVNGKWSALRLALGCAGVLTVRALVSLPREVFMRRKSFVAGFVCAGIASLFLLAPTFRQALNVSISPWKIAFAHNPGLNAPAFSDTWPDRDLHTIVASAHARHDAKALAFVAVRLADAEASARLAEEAVHLDPQLTWIYAIVALRHPSLREIPKWVERLDQWDPENVLTSLITVERIDIEHIVRGDIRPGRKLGDLPDWRTAMEHVFQARKFDDYLSSQLDTDREVALRYQFFDPLVILAGFDGIDGTFTAATRLPSYGRADVYSYSQTLIEKGQDLEARGDLSSAVPFYSSVARIDQIIESHRMGSAAPAIKAYERLAVISDAQGHHDQASLFAYLSRHLELKNRSLGDIQILSGMLFSPSWMDVVAIQISAFALFLFSGSALA